METRNVGIHAVASVLLIGVIGIYVVSRPDGGGSHIESDLPDQGIRNTEQLPSNDSVVFFSNEIGGQPVRPPAPTMQPVPPTAATGPSLSVLTLLATVIAGALGLITLRASGLYARGKLE